MLGTPLWELSSFLIAYTIQSLKWLLQVCMYLLNCGKMHIKFIVLTILKCTIQEHITFPVLCSHHNYVVPQHFHYPKRKLTPIKEPLPLPPSPCNCSSAFCLSLMALSILYLANIHMPMDISYKWNHVRCGLLWLASDTQHVFKIHPGCSTYLHSLFMAE